MINIAFLYLTITTPNKTIDYLIKKKYNIYIHPKNSIDSKYSKYIISNTIETKWATYSLVGATINLLKAAYNDNDYFVFCSGDSYLLTNNFSYNGLSSFDFIMEGHDNTQFKNIYNIKFYKSSQFCILNKKDALVIINSVNKYKYFKDIKIINAIDEYYFLTVLMNENKKYKYNKFNHIYKRWLCYTLNKSPVTFNKLTEYDILDLKKKKPYFIRKVLPTFTIKKYNNKNILYILLIGTKSNNLNYFINSDIDLIIFSCINTELINIQLLNKCICIYNILYNQYFIAILSLTKYNIEYLKQWNQIYFINETYNMTKFNKNDFLSLSNEYKFYIVNN
jgi:hypothetical protein